MVLGTRKSHMRCLTHYFHSFLFSLAYVEVERCVLVHKTAFLRKLEFPNLTVQVIYFAIRWQAHIHTARETHTKFEDWFKKSVKSVVFQPTCAKG